LPGVCSKFATTIARRLLHLLLQFWCVFCCNFVSTIPGHLLHLPRFLLQICRDYCWTFATSITAILQRVLLRICRDYCWTFATAFVNAILPCFLLHNCCNYC
jgi:hypothetical protein